MLMKTEVRINLDADPAANYVSWAPAKSEILLSDAGGATNPVNVRLKNQDSDRGGQVIFSTAAGGLGQDELQLSLPSDGSPLEFFVAGKFGKASVDDRDCVIEVVEVSGGAVLSTLSLMVRIRKNANDLTAAERDRFINAFARLNDRGLGKFRDFRNIHTDAGSPEAHRKPGFLPWHRAFILDLERELQRIDPSVTLPFWRFDQPAPRLFTQAFIGTSRDGNVEFASSNPLTFWTTDTQVGIKRAPIFNTRTGSPNVLDEFETLRLGNAKFAGFRSLESNPHGSAHGNFGGFLGLIGTAARDPLFFLLHTNVDRLWAKWQWVNRRYDIGNTDTFSPLGSAGDPGGERVGHNSEDTMWPWNQITKATDPNRPPSAPGGPFPNSLIVAAPGPAPQVRDMIDYQGMLNAASRLGFDYIDVPFEI